jgi:hypothetical protein
MHSINLDVHKMISLAKVIAENEPGPDEVIDISPAIMGELDNPQMLLLQDIYELTGKLESAIYASLDFPSDLVIERALQETKTTDPLTFKTLNEFVEMYSGEKKFNDKHIMFNLIPIVVISKEGLNFRPSFEKMNKDKYLEDLMMTINLKSSKVTSFIVPEFYFESEINQLSHRDVYAMVHRAKQIFAGELDKKFFLPMTETRENKTRITKGPLLNVFYVLHAMCVDTSKDETHEIITQESKLNYEMFAMSCPNLQTSNIANYIKMHLQESIKNVDVAVLALRDHCSAIENVKRFIEEMNMPMIKLLGFFVNIKKIMGNKLH